MPVNVARSVSITSQFGVKALSSPSHTLLENATEHVRALSHQPASASLCLCVCVCVCLSHYQARLRRRKGWVGVQQQDVYGDALRPNAVFPASSCPLSQFHFELLESAGKTGPKRRSRPDTENPTRYDPLRSPPFAPRSREMGKTEFAGCRVRSIEACPQYGCLRVRVLVALVLVLFVVCNTRWSVRKGSVRRTRVGVCVCVCGKGGRGVNVCVKKARSK